MGIPALSVLLRSRDVDIEQGRLVESCRGFPEAEKAIRGAPEALRGWVVARMRGCADARLSGRDYLYCGI